MKNQLIKPFIFLIVVWFLAAVNAIAQPKKELERDRKQLLKEIEFIGGRLNKVRNMTKTSLNEVVILSRQINAREKLIQSYEKEVSFLSNEINKNQNNIVALNKDLEALKKQYALMIIAAANSKNTYTEIVFVLSAIDFNQAYQRLTYIRQYNQARRNQADRLLSTQTDLRLKIQELNEQVTEKRQLLTQQQQATQDLIAENEQKNMLIKELQRNAKALEADLKEKTVASQRLEYAINELINKEIARAEAQRRKIAEKNKLNDKETAKNNKTDTKTTTINTSADLIGSPQLKEISSSFAKNKGRLPWPVSKGFVSETFGAHPHAVIKNVIQVNNGINITTAEGEKVACVFVGEVTGIVSIPGMQKTVIVRHGEFLTVYSHLDEVFVKFGEKLAIKQAIGTVFTDTNEGKTEIQFQLWKVKEKLNPLPWLARLN